MTLNQISYLAHNSSSGTLWALHQINSNSQPLMQRVSTTLPSR